MCVFAMRRFTFGDDQPSVFCWTSHHVIMDGWSLPLLLRDVFGGSDDQPGPPFHRYIEFLEKYRSRHGDAAETFWRTQMHALNPPRALPWMRPQSQRKRSRRGSTVSIESKGDDGERESPCGDGAGDSIGVEDTSAGVPPSVMQEGVAGGDPGFPELQIVMGAAWTQSLAQYARDHGVTSSSVLQGAWLLVLSTYLDSLDVTTGLTVCDSWTVVTLVISHASAVTAKSI